MKALVHCKNNKKPSQTGTWEKTLRRLNVCKYVNVLRMLTIGKPSDTHVIMRQNQ